MKNVLTLLLICISISSIAQVGIGNTNPQANLDISASNQSSPSNNDGLLIPRIDAFPTTNPTATQNSMIVYLTNTDGSNSPGFYYWNNATTSWLPFSGGGTDTQDLSIDNTTADLSLVDGGTVELKTIADSDDDTKIQTEEGTDEDVIRFDVAGNEMFTMNSRGNLQVFNTGQSVFVGEEAGENHDNSATRRNTFIGFRAGEEITTSVNNIAIGWQSLDRATTGSNNNTAIGQNTLGTLTTGSSNVAIGNGAFWVATSVNNSVAIGLNALSNSTASTDNVAVGKSAGANVDGSSNVFLGVDADAFNHGTSALRNTIVGAQAGESSISGTAGGVTYEGRVLVGYGAGGDNGISNTLFIENSDSRTPLIGGDFANDRVGINMNIDADGSGTAVLTHTLTVGGDVYASGGFQTPTNNYPDYVFENYFTGTSEIDKNYTFTPLQDAITFVKENGHLPNVKSYAEVASEDMQIDLGETSVKNLEKIEENFLYIAELHVKIESVTQENTALKSQLLELVKRLVALENK